MDPTKDPITSVSAEDAADTGADANDSVDLDAYLSVLERDQLERLVVRMILKDESNFDELERAAKMLGEDAILECIESAQVALDETGLEAFLALVSPYVDKAVSYAKLGYATQALTVLVNITQPIVSAITERTFPTISRSILHTSS